MAEQTNPPSKAVGVGMDKVIELFDEYVTTEDLIAMVLNTETATEIIRRRLDLGMDKAQFADLLGITKNMVTRIECGLHKFSLKEIASFAVKLGLDVKIEFKLLPEEPSR